jgi:hypothetical protein
MLVEIWNRNDGVSCFPQLLFGFEAYPSRLSGLYKGICCPQNFDEKKPLKNNPF